MVQPESQGDTLVLRPLGGTDDEVTGIYLPLEKVELAVLPQPDLTKAGPSSRNRRIHLCAVALGTPIDSAVAATDHPSSMTRVTRSRRPNG